MKTAIIAAVLATAAIGAAQQHESTSADKLKEMAGAIGTWSGKQNFNMGDGKTMSVDATDKIEFAVGGRFIEERLSTTRAGREPSDVRHILTYDPKAGRYRAWWFNDTSVDPLVFEGTMDGAKLVMESVPGQKSHLRVTYEHQSETQFSWTLELKQGEAWQKLFTASYTKAP